MVFRQSRPGDLKEEFNGGRVVVDEENPRAHTVVGLHVKDRQSVFAYVIDHYNQKQFIIKFDRFGRCDRSYAEKGRLNLERYGQVVFDGEGRALHYTLESQSVMTIRRYLGDGRVDHEFGVGGACTINISAIGARFPEGLIRPPQALKMDAVATDKAATFGWVQIIADGSGMYLVTGADIEQTSKYFTLVARITQNGNLDTTFGNDGFFVYRASPDHINYPRGVAIDKALLQLLILVYEPSSAVDGVAGVIRLARDGGLDESFKTSKIDDTVSNAFQGPILDVANTFKVAAALHEGLHLFGLKQEGGLDDGFNDGLPMELTAPDNQMEYFYALSTQGENGNYRILHLGYSTQEASITRLLADGNADTCFGSEGTSRFARQPVGGLSTPLQACILDNNEVVFAVGHELFWVLG